MMTDEWIKEQLAICEAATPGPWEFDANCTLMSGGGEQVLHAGEGSFIAPKDQMFIEDARTGYPRVLRELQAIRKAAADLQSERERSRKRHQDVITVLTGPKTPGYGAALDRMRLEADLTRARAEADDWKAKYVQSQQQWEQEEEAWLNPPPTP